MLDGARENCTAVLKKKKKTSWDALHLSESIDEKPQGSIRKDSHVAQMFPREFNERRAKILCSSIYWDFNSGSADSEVRNFTTTMRWRCRLV